MRFYALWGVDDAPRELTKRRASVDGAETVDVFHCHFPLPLPNNIVAFATGPVAARSTATLSVALDAGHAAKNIGTLDARQKALSIEVSWTPAEMKLAKQLEADSRMVKMTINLVEEHTLALTPPVTAIKAKSKARLRDDGDDDDAGITEKPVASASRKRRKSSVGKAPAKALSKSAGKNAKAAAAAGKAAVDKPEDTPVPTARWGHTMCKISNGLALMVGG